MSLNDNNKVLIFSMLGAVVFFIFIMPMLDKKRDNMTKNIIENIENSSFNFIKGIDNNMCSKQCCKHTQWPVPHDIKTKDMSDEDAAKMIGSNMTCNYGKGSGCVCFTKDNFNYLADRAGNSSDRISCANTK
jgi:hypothetical protein